MTPRTILKIAFALGGLVVFGVGIRMGNDTLRYVGIALVGIAWVLRFWKGPAANSSG